MTDQIKSVETFQTDVDQVATALAEAKKLEDETLKKTKAETALLKAESAKTAIESAKDEASKKLKALEGKTDATSKAEITKLESEIKEYEEMLTALDESKTELTKLKAGVTSEAEEKTTEKTEEKKEEKKEEKEEKSDRNRIQRQWDGVTSKEERKTNTGANIARVAGGIGVVAIGIRGIKKLFGRGKKKETTNADGTTQTTEKKGFWQTGVGKVLKRTGIGTGAYYLVHGLVTGRWGITDFFNRDKREKINPDDLNDWYDEKVPEKLKPKYDKFAGNVEDYRKAAGNSGTLSDLEDKEGKSVEIKRGAIPAAMDNAYDNVGDILDTSGDIYDKRGRCGQKLWGLVSDVGGKAVGALLRGGVGLINGLTSSMFGDDGEPNDEFKEWAEKEDLTRDEQVSNLLQKYSMVRTYLNDKRKQLTRKYTIEQLKLEGVSNPTEEQIEDYETNKDMVEMRVERDFLDKKIVSEDDAGSVVTALETQGIYDATVSVETQAILDEVKDIRKEIVPDETIWERSKASADINKDDALRTELSGVSTRFSAHLKEGILHRNILEGIANAWGILNLDELWNSEADDLEEAMESLGFGDEVKRFALQNNDFYSKLQSKTLTKTDIEAFEKTINDYFSLLQQVMLETQTQQENEGWWEWKTWFMGRLYTLVSSGGTYVIVGGALLNTGMKNLFKMKKSPVKYVLDFTLPKAKSIFREPMRRVNVPRVLGNRYLKRRTYGESAAQCDKFIKDFKKGSMTYDEAKDVFNHHSEKYSGWKSKAGTGDGTFNGLLQKEYNLTVEQIQTMENNFNNKNVLKILSDGETTFPDLIKKLKAYENAVDAITDADKAKAIIKLFKKCKFTQLSDIDNIVKNIEKIDGDALAKLSDKELKILGEGISDLTTADKINVKINEIKKATGTAADVVDDVVSVLDDVKINKLNNLIDTDLKTLRQTLTDMGTEVNPGPNFSKIRANYYEQSIESLEAFKKNVKTLSELDYGTIVKFSTHGFGAGDIAKIYRLKAVEGLEDIEDALKRGDFDDLTTILHAAKDDVRFTKYADDIGDLATKFDTVGKKVIAMGDDIGTLLKGLIKVFTKLT